MLSLRTIGLTILLGLVPLLMSQESWSASAERQPVAKTESPGRGPSVTLELDRGTITIELYPEVAPKTVARFSELVKQGFYNGLSFYRVLPKFLVQTGDPVGDGTGGSGRTLPAEFNDKKHLPGTVGVAHKQDPDSADSQFYICLEAQPFLDGKYTVFGQVTEGLELLPKIMEREIIRRIIVKS